MEINKASQMQYVLANIRKEISLLMAKNLQNKYFTQFMWVQRIVQKPLEKEKKYR